MAITMDSIVKLPPAKKALILIVVAFALVGAYVYLAYLPLREEIMNLSHQRDQLVKEVNESRAVVKNLERFKK